MNTLYIVIALCVVAGVVGPIAFSMMSQKQSVLSPISASTTMSETIVGVTEEMQLHAPRQFTARVVKFDRNGQPKKALFMSKSGTPLIADVLQNRGYGLTLCRKGGAAFHRDLAHAA